MAHEATVLVGSGLNPLKQVVPFNQTSKERHLTGTSVAVLNPEDASAGMSGLASNVSVGGTAALLPTTPLKYRRAIAIFNNDSLSTLFIGFDAAVTTGNGWPIPAGASISLDINSDVKVYGIAGSTIDVRLLELS